MKTTESTREEIKNKLRQNFDGKIVRKDLTKKIKEGANVPVYVLEFLLGQYCSSDDETVIEKGRYKNVNEQILAYNKKLVSLRNYYEQLVGIAERLYENENGIFDGEKAYYFKTVADRSNRLCSEINLFRENLVRLREAYQARLDLKMNSTMKLLPVITVIFLPLTLITGWYGMNFVNMPELSSPYGYPAVIAVSVAIVISCIIIFRKKKLL